MSIVSVLYLAFLSLVAVLYYAAPQTWRTYILLAASWVFYGVNQGAYLLILLLSIGVNYLLCRKLALNRNKVWLYFALSFNIALLGFYKYIPPILGISHNPTGSWIERMVIPIGLSFFSFQAMGNVLDMYWGNARMLVKPQDYALYMSFFPQLLSGPIARSKSFFPQINTHKTFVYEDVVGGVRRILWGLFKKLVIASNLAPYTDIMFQNPSLHGGFSIGIAAMAYTVQIYMDFSGYSDIAIGSAKVLGFNLGENFRIPLFANSVTDFWRRWHISLSSWVRDYIFMPMQFQVRTWGKTGLIFSTLITFLVIGVWHGANWTLVIFGFLQGLAICWEMFSSGIRQKLWGFLPAWLGRFCSSLLVFVFITISAILLRSPSLSEAIRYYSLFSFDVSGLYLGSRQQLVFAGLGMLLVFGVDIRKGDMLISDFWGKQNTLIRWSFYILGTLAILLIGSLSSENFIYYQY